MPHPRLRTGLFAVVAAALLASGWASAQESASTTRFRLEREVTAVRARFQSGAGTVQERRQALAGVARSIRAARGLVPSQVMEDYRALSAEAFKLKHGKDRPPAPISEM